MQANVIRGFIPSLLLIAACSIAMMAGHAGAQSTSAGQSAADYLKPIVTQRQFTDLIRPLELSREQRMIVELVYEDYREHVEQAKREHDREADARGRRIVADALSGRRLIPPDELRHHRLEVLRVYRTLPATAHELAEQLVADLRSVLVADQRPKLDEQMATLRRMLYLHPRHLSRTDYEYAGEGVDVLRLVEEARHHDGKDDGKDGGELAGVPMDALAPVLQEYETELDALVRRTAVSHAEIAIDARMARIARDDRAAREAERRSLEQWRSLYELNQRTVDRIGELATTHAGDEAARKWQRRFERETFAWMFTPTRPDRIYEWMVNEPLDDERLDEAAAIREDYQSDRWPLLREAADIMIRSRSEFETVVYSMMDPSELRGTPRSLYRELLLNSGRLASVESRAVAELESLLDDDERRRMRRAVRMR